VFEHLYQKYAVLSYSPKIDRQLQGASRPSICANAAHTISECETQPHEAAILSNVWRYLHTLYDWFYRPYTWWILSTTYMTSSINHTHDLSIEHIHDRSIDHTRDRFIDGSVQIPYTATNPKACFLCEFNELRNTGTKSKIIYGFFFDLTWISSRPSNLGTLFVILNTSVPIKTVSISTARQEKSVQCFSEATILYSCLFFCK